MKFCDFIRQRRELLGLTQKELAAALSVDVPRYSRYERGQRPIKEEHLSTIASKLNVNFNELRKMWIVDKVLSVVHEERDASDILNIVAENINEIQTSKNGD